MDAKAKSSKTKATTEKAVTPEGAQEAFEKIKPLLAALRPEEIAIMNVDVPAAASLALGAYERLVELRPQIVAHLPKHAVDLLDQLPTLALGAWFAHLVSLPAEGDTTRTDELLAEAAILRDNLLVAAEALAHRKLLDADRVSEIRSGLGNIDRANDLVALATLFSQAWSTVEGKTAVTKAEIDRATTLGPQLLMALGIKGMAARTASTPEARDQRARAFTLLERAYDECRRAATYLRWHDDDLDTYAPVLRQRNRSGSAGSAAHASPTTNPPPAAPTSPGNGATA
jgi:hypothetical protein